MFKSFLHSIALSFFCCVSLGLVASEKSDLKRKSDEPLTIIFFGPSGTGKSSLGKRTQREVENSQLFSIDYYFQQAVIANLYRDYCRKDMRLKLEVSWHAVGWDQRLPPGYKKWFGEHFCTPMELESTELSKGLEERMMSDILEANAAQKNVIIEYTFSNQYFTETFFRSLKLVRGRKVFFSLSVDYLVYVKRWFQRNLDARIAEHRPTRYDLRGYNVQSQNQLKLVQEQIEALQRDDSKVHIIDTSKHSVEDLFQEMIKPYIGI